MIVLRSVSCAWMLLLVAAPSCSRSPTLPQTAPTDASRDAGSAGPSPERSAEGAVDRGPTRLAIDGDPNGLLWDASRGELLVADGDGGRILRFTDAEGIREFVRLPGETSTGRGLGQLVRTEDGTVIVTHFRGGAPGGVVAVSAEGKPTLVPGLDPARRRIGLALAPDGTLYTAWFQKHGERRVGAVGRLDLAGRETTVLEGFQKPVGLAVVGDALFVADQRAGTISRAPLSNPAQVEVLVPAIADPDLLCAGPDGGAFTGGKNGQVRRIDRDGTVTVVAEGLASARGVAWDEANARLFVAEHDDDATDGIAHALHILPFDDR